MSSGNIKSLLKYRSSVHVRILSKFLEISKIILIGVYRLSYAFVNVLFWLKSFLPSFDLGLLLLDPPS
jgi:hypothetical protein